MTKVPIYTAARMAYHKHRKLSNIPPAWAALLAGRLLFMESHKIIPYLSGSYPYVDSFIILIHYFITMNGRMQNGSFIICRKQQITAPANMQP